MGVNYNDQISQNNFRVVYHEKIDYNETKESLEKMGILTSINRNYHPVYGEYKISLNKDVDYITPYDFRFDKIFSEAYKEVYGKEFDKDRLSYKVSNQLCDILLSKNKHRAILCSG